MMHPDPSRAAEMAAPFEMAASSYHGSEISPEDAAAINNSVRIIAYGYNHGSVAERSSHAAYDSAQAIVDSLDPARGDVLFTEIAGHNGSYPVPDPSYGEEFVHALAGVGHIASSDYLVYLATARGIPVVPADMHADMVRAFGDDNGVQDPLDNARFPGWPLHTTFHTGREEQGANTVKDYAVAALPALTARANEGLEPPIYALAYGDDHLHGVPSTEGSSPGLGAAFGRMGLNVELRQTPSANAENRREATLRTHVVQTDVESDFV